MHVPGCFGCETMLVCPRHAHSATANIERIYGPEDDTDEAAAVAERAVVREQQRADMAARAAERDDLCPVAVSL